MSTTVDHDFVDALLTVMRDGVAAHDADDAIVQANARVCLMSGYDQESNAT